MRPVQDTFAAIADETQLDARTVGATRCGGPHGEKAPKLFTVAGHGDPRLARRTTSGLLPRPRRGATSDRFRAGAPWGGIGETRDFTTAHLHTDDFMARTDLLGPRARRSTWHETHGHDARHDPVGAFLRDERRHGTVGNQQIIFHSSSTPLQR